MGVLWSYYDICKELLPNENSNSFELDNYYTYIFYTRTLYFTKFHFTGGDMKKLFTILSFLLSISAYSQPVMDGTFDGEAVWGTPKAVADNNTGWASAQAKKFYVTSDANYLYLGAEVTASFWMAWAFIINTKPGGATSDSWTRRVYYNHANLPDFTARGHFDGWAEIYRWTGTQWQRDPDAGLASTEYGENVAGSLADGWVEIRVPQSTLGSPSVGDIQFYITGDYNEHGSFDACPDDDNATSWTDSSTISNYQSNIIFSKTLNLTALIQGFYDGATMISDTISVELRDASTPALLKDKDDIVVLDPAGIGAANFYSAADATNYYIALKHRNSIETWSKTAVAFSSGSLNYDFTTAANKAFGDNMILKGTKWCIYSGDVIRDEFIDGSDVSVCFNDASIGQSGYIVTDVTGDDFVDGTDVSIIFNNASMGIGSAHP